ncbi:ABC transporter ATP-binding protein [Kocuria sp. cx-116]|uniref:ABC transporter ATP-binding protein n=1 Tax=Kocuria sp. cx-116 TaxID=2771378 RepID=UPI0016838485|nr:ABC transporter ATP-binding protein [Kocuria sp. cx-116]MBD2762470.1 ABC transporter ATP-binding protein [Kocuria sp. cx-116]
MNTSATSSPSLSAPTTTPLAPAIECSQVHQVFRTRKETVHAVNNVSLRIDRGEIVALLGPNGAGKTTLLDIVLGMSDAEEGTVSVFGRSPREAVSCGLVGAVQQTGGLLDDLSVRETVVMIAALYRQHMPVDEALERAGATSFARRKVSKCSGGQQQRVRFALALLPEPDLLVLDEPTAGMDVQSRHDFWDTMHAEAREGRTVVFATHYLQEAEDFAQRVVLLDRGAVHHDGTVDSFRSASTHQTVSFVWPEPTPLPNLPGVTRLDRTGSRVIAHTHESDRLARVLLTQTPAAELEISRGGLEEAFTALISRSTDT